ncbi:metallophosphoesterase [Alkalicoccus saliphilus]|uniref:metallophosphoesterase n=1 Tax=Alkalicoccus saliphilus TaxID=200989 RepID=UPI001356EA3D|nr:metallophosphoesterase [Alkalicoccus saliphilus]
MCVLILVYYESNERIVVKEETVYIEDLPASFENYTILQVADLHEKQFGRNQKRLIQRINNLSYDAVAFTGDMLKEEGSIGYKPAFDLIEGIDNLDKAWFVTGNTDKQKESRRNVLVDGLEKRGVPLLNGAEIIEKGKDKLVVIEFEALQRYFKQKNKSEVLKGDGFEINQLDKAVQNSDVIISLFHYPLTDVYIDELFEEGVNLSLVDLHIAGHYHGGQIRIPFVGAVFIPKVERGSSKFFPNQSRVRWHWEYRTLQQYVSTGLGSSNAVPFLDFRLFNPPEINLITLKRKQ